MKCNIKKDTYGIDVCSDGKQHLRIDSVFIRADGVVMISGNLNAGPLRSDLTPEERAMVNEFPLVKRLSIK